MIAENTIKTITAKAIELQDTDNCWNVLNEGDRGYPKLKHYSPLYNSTLWVLILLADIECDSNNKKLLKPLGLLVRHFFDKNKGIFSIGKSHFPIPCLNGNMLYLLGYFNSDQNNISEGIIDFFSRYQRFEDGNFKTPNEYPYYSNKSCYGKHTCYWGVVKLFKGLSFIPKSKRSKKAKSLINHCIDFILHHEVCFSSHQPLEFLHTNIKKLTFPNMYQADYLEILWLLKREKVKSDKLKRSLDLLKSKMKPDFTWEMERSIKNLIVPITKKKYGSELVTKRAREVAGFYKI